MTKKTKKESHWFSGYPKYGSLKVVKSVNQARICARLLEMYILTIYSRENCLQITDHHLGNEHISTHVKDLKENIEYRSKVGLLIVGRYHMIYNVNKCI